MTVSGAVRPLIIKSVLQGPVERRVVDTFPDPPRNLIDSYFSAPLVHLPLHYVYYSTIQVIKSRAALPLLSIPPEDIT
jgi:hypothetical protein